MIESPVAVLGALEDCFEDPCESFNLYPALPVYFCCLLGEMALPLTHLSQSGLRVGIEPQRILTKSSVLRFVSGICVGYSYEGLTMPTHKEEMFPMLRLFCFRVLVVVLLSM